MRNITKIYVHTLAVTPDENGEIRDSTMAAVRRYHMGVRGWSDAGYHFLIRYGGEVETGRPIHRAGAGVKGDNRNSIHIAFSGHGDFKPLTPEQKESFVALAGELCDEYGLDPMTDIVGHREFWTSRQLQTAKTCPGKLVNMDELRVATTDAMIEPEVEGVGDVGEDDTPRRAYDGVLSVPWNVSVAP